MHDGILYPYLPEMAFLLIALLIAIGVSLLIQYYVKNNYLAIALSTLLSPMVGLTFLAVLVSPLYLYYLFGLPVMLAVSLAVSLWLRRLITTLRSRCCQ